MDWLVFQEREPSSKMEELLRAGISKETGDIRAAKGTGCLVVQGLSRVGAEDLTCRIYTASIFFRFWFWAVREKQLGSTGMLR